MARQPSRTDDPAALRALIDHEPIVRCLGAHDVLSAKLIQQAGLESIFLGGFGCSASMLGLPDMNLLTLSNMTDVARRVVQAIEIPLIVDGDNGHGDLHNVQRTISQFEQIGAAGVLIEDQASPKRCGHFENKQVIPAREMAYKIEAARDARTDPDLVLIARTDARSVHGLDDAIARANLYARAGADVCYIEAPETQEELERIPQEVVGVPLLANMLNGGKTPMCSVAELRDMGYRIVLWPIASILICGRAIQKLARSLLEEGDTTGVQDELMDFKEMQQLLGLPHFESLRGRIAGRVDRRLPPS